MIKKQDLNVRKLSEVAKSFRKSPQMMCFQLSVIRDCGKKQSSTFEKVEAENVGRKMVVVLTQLL